MLKYDLTMNVAAFEEKTKFATRISVQTIGFSPVVTLGDAVQELIDKQHSMHCLKFSAQRSATREHSKNDEESESTTHEEDK